MRETRIVSAAEIAAQREFINKIYSRNKGLFKQPLAFVETYGCQQNSSDSEKIMGMLSDMGFGFCKTAQEADLVLYNTCAVRENAELRVFGNIGALKHEKRRRPDMIIAVCGCMMQQEHIAKTIKKKYDHVDLVFGTHALYRFPQLLDGVINGGRVFDTENEEGSIFEEISYKREAPPLAKIPIMYGCNNFCTYCIVPYVRGREVSRSPKAILEELEQLSARKVKEVTLLGQNVNSYTYEDETYGKVDFPQLMQMIAAFLKKIDSSIGWVRFMSSHPKDISEKLIDVIAKERVICRHIHLPVQHGSTKVLQEMNRRYTREDYLAKINMIRQKLPDVSLTTDIMLGFPGETEEDFQDCITLLETVGYEAAFMYYYNPREGTKAYAMENQIPLEVKKSRLSKVIDIQLAINRREMTKRVGTVAKVLVECVSKDNEKELLGRTEQDEHVVFPATKDLIGSFTSVKILELVGNTFKGELV